MSLSSGVASRLSQPGARLGGTLQRSVGGKIIPTGEENMGWFRSGAGSGVAVLLALFVGWAPRAAAQASSDASRPQKSVYGKLQSVDKSLNGVVMLSDAGQRLAWRFDARVIAEAAKFKPGDSMIVIYRQLAHNEKRVTAIAFPGTATSPIYVNTTGSRVVLRTGPGVNGACGQAEAGPINESTIPIGGRAEAMEACWCCASPGEACIPGNKSGLGQAFLVHCFK